MGIISTTRKQYDKVNGVEDKFFFWNVFGHEWAHYLVGTKLGFDMDIKLHKSRVEQPLEDADMVDDWYKFVLTSLAPMLIFWTLSSILIFFLHSDQFVTVIWAEYMIVVITAILLEQGIPSPPDLRISMFAILSRGLEVDVVDALNKYEEDYLESDADETTPE